jgi:hypothetical protein
MSNRDDFESWLAQGIKRGWCSRPVCDTHDGVPWTEEEVESHWVGKGMCVPAVRVYGLEKVH